DALVSRLRAHRGRPRGPGGPAPAAPAHRRGGPAPLPHGPGRALLPQHHRRDRHPDGRHRRGAGHRLVLSGRSPDREGPRVTHGRLSPRALNRSALHRQLLLDRAPLTALQAVGHLAGLQAQATLAPYVGLWTRLAGFRHEELKELITERAVLRAHLMRNTVHLVDAGDYLRLRPLYQPVLARHLAGNFGKNLIGVDLAELAAVAADLLGQTPLTRVELGARVAPPWPGPQPRPAHLPH